VPCNKVPGSPKAVGYWGRSPYERIEQEQSPAKIRALLQDKLLARGQAVFLYQPVTSGIECSCRKDTNQANDRPCPECYGTGFVPGYLRFLHETLFFTATQVDSLVPLNNVLGASLVGPTGAVLSPGLTGGVVASSGLSAGLVGPTGSVLSATLTVPGALSALPWDPSTLVPAGAAVTTNGAGLNNLELERKFKPNYLRLVDTALTGTLTTAAIPYSNPNGDVWSFSTDTYTRGVGGSVTVEYSFDAGATFHLTGSGVQPPAGDGFLIFRVTITRTSTDQPSSFFSAVRARHVQSDRYRTAQLTALRGRLEPGQILVLRPWVVEQAQSDTGRGTLVEWLTDRSWTMPLDFFDTGIGIDTPQARIIDRAPGPHPFYEHATGIKTGDRVVLSSFKWNEEFGTFTHQSFDERRAQDNEPPYADIF
jgi:hypothetical protein